MCAMIAFDLSIVRRPLLLRRARFFERRTAQPFFEGFELCFQCLNFLVLPKNHVAELVHRLLEVRDLCLHPFQ